MPAYLIVDVDVTDPEKFERYRLQVAPTLERYGGAFLVRGGKVEVLEGEWLPKRVVVLRFESAARAREWWSSEEYRAPKQLRQEASRTNLILVEGVAEPP